MRNLEKGYRILVMKFTNPAHLLHQFFTPPGYHQVSSEPQNQKEGKMSTQLISKQTQKNWWIDAALFANAIAAALSGIYFLFLPSNGYQGGRNPYYNFTILFSRSTWDNLHTWGGVAMIAAAIIHLAIHWPWVVSMARRTWKGLTSKGGGMNGGGRWNLILNSLVAVSFILTALSGVYFLFVPSGRWAADPGLLFSRTTWDLIHTWAGVTLTAAALIHLVIHWKWVTKVTRKMAQQWLPGRRFPQPAPVTDR
jgi:cytochrome b subunit of formate dehydrogenase